MRSTLILLLLLSGFNSYGQQSEKKPEAKLATAPVSPKDNKKPEAKLADFSTVNEKKLKERNTGIPEPKLISK